MAFPLVSVIIPLYNAEKYISETIESVLNQTYQNIEIIIIDDGSTDNSFAIASSFKKENISIFQQENKGASAARNYGLRKAKGEYIQFLDADDFLSRNKINKQISLLKHNLDLAFCNWVRVYRNSIGSFAFNYNDLQSFTPKDFFLQNVMVTVHSWLCHRDLINKAGNWDEKISVNDDEEYFTRVIKNSHKIIYINETAYYRSNIHNSLSNRNNLKAITSIYESILSFESNIQEFNQDKTLNLVIKKKLATLFIMSFPKYPNIFRLIEEKMEKDLKLCKNFLPQKLKILATIIGIKNALYIKHLFIEFTKH